jgi:hypothetical protein
VVVGAAAWLCLAGALLVPWFYVEIVNVDGSKEKFAFSVRGVAQLDEVADCELNFPRGPKCDNYKSYALLTWVTLVAGFTLLSASLLLELKGMYHIGRGDYAPRLFRWGARISVLASIVSFLAPMTWWSNFSDGYGNSGKAQVGYYAPPSYALFQPPSVCDHVAWTLLNLTAPINSLVVSSITTDCLGFDNFGLACFGFIYAFLHIGWSHSTGDKQAKLQAERMRQQRALAVVRNAAGGPELSREEVAAAASSDDLARNPALVAWRLKKSRQAAPAEGPAQHGASGF